MKFKDKTAVVTGGANGIGRCIAEHFAAAGAQVAVIDMDKAAGEMLEEKFAGQIFFFYGDVGRESDLDAFVKAVLTRFPSVNFLINNAMKSKGGILSECSYEDFEYALRIGITAPYYLTMRFKEHFAPSAAVVNISSSRSSQSQPNTESYTAAKGGIAALTHGLSVSLSGIARVNAIAPGWIDTSLWQKNGTEPKHSVADCIQHPAGRVGKPEDIARLTMFLCSEDAGFITGQEIFADGGMSKLMVYHNDCGWEYKK